MKPQESVKETKEAGLAAVRALLRRLPGAELTDVAEMRHAGSRLHADGVVRLRHGDTVHLLLIEVKAHGAPRLIRSAVHQLHGHVAEMRQRGAWHGADRIVPMLVSPYLSPRSRSICHDHGVAYLDLQGNARLALDGIYIERSVPTKPKPEARALRSIFTPKAAAILRALLRAPARPWLVADLATSANASLGHVSNVCKALHEREWVDRRQDGIVLTQPNALFQTWRENYRRPRGERIDAYTHLHGLDLDERIRPALNAQPGLPRAVYSLASAAQWIAPLIRGPTTSFYTDEAGARHLRETLDLKPVGMGPNVALLVTTDESILDDAIEPLPSVLCTDPITTCLDLWCGNDREREAADQLAREALPWIE